MPPDPPSSSAPGVDVVVLAAERASLEDERASVAADAAALASGRDEIDATLAALAADAARARAALSFLADLTSGPVAEEAAAAAEQVAGLLVPRVADGCVAE